MAKPYRRSFFRITDARFQRDFIALGMFIAIVSSSIVLAGTWFVVQDFKNVLSEVETILGHSFGLTMSARLDHAWMMMVFACLLNMAIVAILLFAFSTRVSGILFRLTKDLNALADGKTVRKIKPRENDFFPDVVTAANRLFKDESDSPSEKQSDK